jgi:hypothetical protein
MRYTFEGKLMHSDHASVWSYLYCYIPYFISARVDLINARLKSLVLFFETSRNMPFRVFRLEHLHKAYDKGSCYSNFLHQLLYEGDLTPRPPYSTKSDYHE